MNFGPKNGFGQVESLESFFFESKWFYSPVSKLAPEQTAAEFFGSYLIFVVGNFFKVGMEVV